MTDKTGYYSEFGGAFIPEVLVASFAELEQAYRAARADPSFFQEYERLMRSYSCRPTPLTFAENLSQIATWWKCGQSRAALSCVQRVGSGARLWARAGPGDAAEAPSA